MGRVAFKQRDVQALLRAAKAEGYLNAAVDKLPDGTLRLLTEAPPAPERSLSEGDAFWDEYDRG